MSNPSPLVRWRDRFGTGSTGLWLLSFAASQAAPYFRSIRPRLLRLDPGHVEARLTKRRAVTNHLGTVHAIAMCNIAEFCGGLVCELSVPPHLRWIPVGMEVSYLALAETDLRAVCQVPMARFSELGDLETPVEVFDTAGTLVFEARIRMRISERKRKTKAEGAV